jgi:hypothetical protein
LVRQLDAIKGYRPDDQSLEGNEGYKRERARPGSANLPGPTVKGSLMVEKQRFPLVLTACCLQKQTARLASIASKRERGDKVKVLRGSPWPRPWSLSWTAGPLVRSKLNRVADLQLVPLLTLGSRSVSRSVSPLQSVSRCSRCFVARCIQDCRSSMAGS